MNDLFEHAFIRLFVVFMSLASAVLPPPFEFIVIVLGVGGIFIIFRKEPAGEKVFCLVLLLIFALIFMIINGRYF